MKLRLVTLLILSALSVNALGQTLISMVQLLSNGERFGGASIEVFGYVNSVGPPAIFLTKEHVRDPSSSVRLEITDAMIESFRRCRSRYVSVVGELSIDEGALFLEKIRSIYDHENVAYCHSEDSH